jgi:hypothetical protein
MKKENQLLSRVLKVIGVSKDETQAEAKQELNLTIDTSDIRAELEAFRQEANALLANAETQIAELTTQLAATTAEKESVSQKLEVATAALVEVERVKQAAIEEAKAAKLAARKEKVVAAIGTEKAQGLLSATEELDDAAFGAVVSALVGSVEAEAKTGLFNEVGVDAKTQDGVATPTHFNTFIKKEGNK